MHNLSYASHIELTGCLFTGLSWTDPRRSHCMPVPRVPAQVRGLASDTGGKTAGLVTWVHLRCDKDRWIRMTVQVILRSLGS